MGTSPPPRSPPGLCPWTPMETSVHQTPCQCPSQTKILDPPLGPGNVYSEVAQKRYYTIFNGTPIGSYTCPTQQCHFEWPWVILSDLAKCSMTRSVARAVSATAELLVTIVFKLKTANAPGSCHLIRQVAALCNVVRVEVCCASLVLEFYAAFLCDA